MTEFSMVTSLAHTSMLPDRLTPSMTVPDLVMFVTSLVPAPVGLGELRFFSWTPAGAPVLVQLGQDREPTANTAFEVVQDPVSPLGGELGGAELGVAEAEADALGDGEPSLWWWCRRDRCARALWLGPGVRVSAAWAMARATAGTESASSRRPVARAAVNTPTPRAAHTARTETRTRKDRRPPRLRLCPDGRMSKPSWLMYGIRLSALVAVEPACRKSGGALIMPDMVG